MQVIASFRMTSLEQLSLTEFSGDVVRPKVYENSHKNVLDIWIDLSPNFDLRVSIHPKPGKIFMVGFIDLSLASLIHH